MPTFDQLASLALCLLAACPLTAIVLSDREPLRIDPSVEGHPWVWDHQTEDAIGAHCLPRAIHQLLRGKTGRYGIRYYPTRQLALDALSRAAILYARGAAVSAGLVPTGLWKEDG